MKTLTCDLCEHEAQGETLEEWMQNMMPHYKEAHADFMQKMGEMSPEEQEAGKKKWMEENKARFDAA